jgi:hypothetical protein
MNSLPHDFSGKSLVLPISPLPIFLGRAAPFACCAALLVAGLFMLPTVARAQIAEALEPPAIAIPNTHFGLPAVHSTGAQGIPTYSKNGYSGTVNFTCVLISEAQSSPNPPECAMYPTSAVVPVNGFGAPELLIFGQGTKLPAGVTQSRSLPPTRFVLGAGGAALAGCLLFGIPARRRAMRNLLAAMLLLVAIGGLSACVTEAKPITAGSYVFRVTGTDSKDVEITAWGDVAITVR